MTDIQQEHLKDCEAVGEEAWRGWEYRSNQYDGAQWYRCAHTIIFGSVHEFRRTPLPSGEPGTANSVAKAVYEHYAASDPEEWRNWYRWDPPTFYNDLWHRFTCDPENCPWPTYMTFKRSCDGYPLDKTEAAPLDEMPKPLSATSLNRKLISDFFISACPHCGTVFDQTGNGNHRYPSEAAPSEAGEGWRDGYKHGLYDANRGHKSVDECQAKADRAELDREVREVLELFRYLISPPSDVDEKANVARIDALLLKLPKVT